jgi:uncharacterized protein
MILPNINIKNKIMNEIKKQLENIEVIDSHLHLGHLANLNMPGASDSNIIATLKEFGVKKAIVSHHGSLSTVEYGNKKLFELLMLYKDFLYGLLVFNPNFEDESLKIIDEFYKEKNIIGIKIHPSWHLCYPADIRYKKFWALAEERKIPVLTHSWNPNVPNKAQKFSDPFNFEEIIKRHPDLKLTLAHAGGRGDYLYKVIDLLEKYPNLYVDFAGDIFEPKLIETYVGRLGSKKLFFGTDMPWIDVRYYLVNILNAEITDEDKENILGLNVARLYRI